MRFLDRLLQTWRMNVAADWIPDSSRVLDIGCHQGEFLDYLGDRIGPSVGMDPILARDLPAGRHQLFSRTLETGVPFPEQHFQAISLLATLEHIPDKDAVARECWRLLQPGGRLVITVPSVIVDRILDALLALHLLSGMSLEEHHGFSPDQLPAILRAQGFQLVTHRRFEFGLNHLFVFERPKEA